MYSFEIEYFDGAKIMANGSSVQEIVSISYNRMLANDERGDNKQVEWRIRAVRFIGEYGK